MKIGLLLIAALIAVEGCVPKYSINLKCFCGRKQSLTNQNPWQVVILRPFRNEFWSVTCGGTLLSSDTVLTAASCVASYSVYVAFQNEDVTLQNDTKIKAAKVFCHPYYSQYLPYLPIFNNDFAIIKLEH